MPSRYVSPALSLKRAEAGRMGGIVNYMKRGPEGMREIGRLGGRPRLKTLEELITQNLCVKKKGDGCRPPSKKTRKEDKKEKGAVVFSRSRKEPELVHGN